MDVFLTKAWLKVLSSLSVNITAALFVTPFIGASISTPKNLFHFALLTADIIFGIMLLLVAHWCERKLENE